jgi:hypothetical protein
MQGGAGADQEFNAMRLVKNEETKRFWAHHFGPKVRFVLRLAFGLVRLSLSPLRLTLPYIRLSR